MYNQYYRFEIKHKEDAFGRAILQGFSAFKNIDLAKISNTRALVGVWYLLKFEAEDEKLKLIITLTEYYWVNDIFFATRNSSDAPNLVRSMRRVSSEYPINPKGVEKAKTEKAFHTSLRYSAGILSMIEMQIKKQSGFKE